MRRLGINRVVASLTAMLAAVPAVHAANLLVSGGSELVIIDGDGDGPDASDCRLTATVNMPLFTVNGSQDPTTPILLCAGSFLGTLFSGTDSSSDYLGATVNSTTVAGVPDLPLIGEFVDEEASPDGPPVRINDTRDYFHVLDGTTTQERGRALPCNAGGPAALVTIPGATSLLMQLQFATDATNREFLRAPRLTFGRTAPNLGVPVQLDAYIPLTSGHILTVALDTAPSDLLLRIDFNGLPACSNRVSARTNTEWGLALALLSVLALGTWRLRRRETFRASLPVV